MINEKQTRATSLPGNLSSVIGHLSFVIFQRKKFVWFAHRTLCREPRVSLLTGGWYGTSYGVHEGVFEEREGLRIADCRLRIAETEVNFNPECEIHGVDHTHPQAKLDSGTPIRHPQSEIPK